MPSDRIRGVILSAGERFGIIPVHAKARYCVRSASLERYKVLKQKFINCLEAAALATGCESRTTWLPAYWDIRSNEVLAGKYVEHMEKLGVSLKTPFEQKMEKECYSADMGNVTYVVPSIHPTFVIESPDGGVHTPGFAAAARTKDAHLKTLSQGKSMAAVALEVLINDDFAYQVKKAFDETDMSIASDPSVA